MVKDLFEKLRDHPERGRRLFWLKLISDEYLDRIYDASACLIAASEGEGFGLPLVEAAQHQLPVIARDIPVFREVAGDHAFYFSGFEPDSLADAVLDWLSLFKSGEVPESSTMPRLTWKQSTQNLLDVILGGKWYRKWMPGGVQRFWGSDSRLSTSVGKCVGRYIVSTGRGGILLNGPRIRLDAGEYRVVVRGALGDNGSADAHFNVTLNNGKSILAQTALARSGVDDCLVSLPISLDAPCTDLETRIWVGEHSQVAVSMIEIQPFQLREAEDVA
jgi:hypothetical protein